MKKIIFLVSMVFALGLNAQIPENNNVKALELSDDGKNQVKQQFYTESGILQSYIIARTNLQKGTYTEYYKDGSIKLFRVIK